MQKLTEYFNMEAKHRDSESDETFDLVCTMCKRKNRNREAEKYCVDCHDYYCLKCVTVHDDVPSLAGHQILDKDQFQSGTGQALPMVPTERCDRHSHKPVDMYCQYHDHVGCYTCMAVEHRSCQGIFYIPEFIEDNEGSQAPVDVQQKLQTAANTLTEHYYKYQRERERLLTKKADSLKIIKKLRNKINDKLDKLEQNSIADIEVRYAAMIDKIDEELRLLKTTKASVTSAQNNLTSAGSNVSQAFVSTRKGKIIASNVVKCIDERKAEIQTEDIDFKTDPKLLTMLEEMTTLGNVTLTNTMKVDHGDSSKVRQPDVLVQITGRKEHCVKVQSDQSVCDIVCACALEDGTIILSDRYSNNKLKRLDSSTYTVTDSCDTPGNPWQVCGISNKQIAVSMQGMKDIHFISLEGKMTITNEMKTDHNCYGLAHANDNLYVSDDHTLYIYSISGTKLKQFTFDQSGQRLFSEINSLAVSEDGCHIYVADYHNGLIVLDNNGLVLGKYNGLELKGAHSVYLTVSGVLVSGRVSNNVLQFGCNGELVGEVLKSDGGDRGCRAVCCDQNMSKMIVGRCKYEIEVFDLT